MRRTHAEFLFALAVTLPFSLTAQQPPPRDAQALAVLARMLAATGWGTPPSDAVASGLVTRYRDGDLDTASLTLKVKGTRKYRTDVLGPSGATGAVFDDGKAAAVGHDGIRAIPQHSAIVMRQWVLPFLADFFAEPDANRTLRYLGTEDLGNESAHKLQIALNSAKSDGLAAVRQRADKLTVWVSEKTSQLLQIQYFRVANDNPTAVLPVIRRFSDYRLVDGLAVPFLQEEFIHGQRTSTLQLNAVTLNAGLADTDFALPNAPLE